MARSNGPFAVLSRRPLAAYFTLAFAISWGGILVITRPTGIPGSGADLDSLLGPVFVAMLAGPFLAAMSMSIIVGGWAAYLKLLGELAIWRAQPGE